jgi:plasmid replication initiation protein
VNALAQPDLFLRGVADAPHRDVIDLMAAPVCTLSAGGRREPIRFKRGDVAVEVRNPAGIHDLDPLLWAVSQIADAARESRPISATVQAPAYDVLKAIGRGVSGKHYAELRAALDRLAGATVRTTMRAPQGRAWATFHLLEGWSMLETADGKVRGLSMTLPGWIVESVVAGRVLATDPRYFGIRSALGRALYRMARKQAGDSATGWRWTMAELHERMASTQPLRMFARDVRQLVGRDDLPEYAVQVFADEAGAECVHAVRRSKLDRAHPGREVPLPRSRRRSPRV